MKKYILLFYLSLFILFPKTQFAQWTKVIDDSKYYIVGIEFKDENTGFAGGLNLESDSAIIIRTLDGGNTWHEVYTQSSFYTGPYCFDFINDTLGISGGKDGALFKTTDGGSSWEYFSGLNGPNDIYTIRFFNDSIGIATGQRTTDGGYSWTWMDIGTTYDIFIMDDSSGFVTTSDGIFFTSDYGESWLKVDPDQDDEYNSVCMATDLIGYAAKNPAFIYKTTDGGMSWFEINSFPFYEIKQIRFIDENMGYMLVNNGSMRIMRTSDGGITWDYVLFGNEQSYQMALVDEATILVPTINGIMYKTTNGGGDPILPRYTEIDWYSKISSHPSSYSPSGVGIDSNSQPYLTGTFYDSVFINESIAHVSTYPTKRGAYIIKYNTWGTLDWIRVIEKQSEDISAGPNVIDINNNMYMIYRESYLGLFKLAKFSEEGDSLWTINLETSDSSGHYTIKTNVSGHIIVTGSFNGTYSFENNSLHTDNAAIFMLELDQDGNFVSLVRVIEALNYIQDIIFDINDEGSICLSFMALGSAYINEDTIGGYGDLLLYLDSDKNLLWHNNNFNTLSKSIYNIIFNSNTHVLLKGRDKINDKFYHVVYQYDEQGNLIDAAYIDPEPVSPQGNGTLCKTANNRVITAGQYNDFAILENDTLFAFARNYNKYIYTLTNNLELVKSSHTSGSFSYINIIENQHNSYLIGRLGNSPSYFANDTIFYNGYSGYFIAKLNSIITPVSEKTSHNKLRVFPNPSTGLFSVVLPERSSENGLMEVYSITGQKVYEIWVSEHNSTLDLSKLNKGIYFVQLSIDRTIFTEKIIIQ